MRCSFGVAPMMQGLQKGSGILCRADIVTSGLHSLRTQTPPLRMPAQDQDDLHNLVDTLYSEVQG